MARYIDTEHADAEVRCLLCDNPVKSENGCDGSCHYDEDLYNKVMEVIGKLSTIDAVEVVRCRNCKWFDPTQPLGTITQFVFKCRLYGTFHSTEFFCESGERREV